MTRIEFSFITGAFACLIGIPASAFHNHALVFVSFVIVLSPIFLWKFLKNDF